MTAEERALEAPTEVAADVWAIRNRAFPSNTYVCRLEDRARCLVIDPGLDHEALDQALERLGVRPSAVFCTHGHFDHIGGAARLQDAFGATLHIHAAERKVVQTANFTMMICKAQGRIAIPTFDIFASDESRFGAGADEVRLVHAPGHTPGSSVLSWREIVFTGDTLFRDSLRAVSFPGEDEAKLRASIARIWDLFPETSTICPGHGRAGPLGRLKRENQAVRAFLGLEAAPPPDAAT